MFFICSNSSSEKAPMPLACIIAAINGGQQMLAYQWLTGKEPSPFFFAAAHMKALYINGLWEPCH
jgi:hypothetical protein